MGLSRWVGCGIAQTDLPGSMKATQTVMRGDEQLFCAGNAPQEGEMGSDL